MHAWSQLPRRRSCSELQPKSRFIRCPKGTPTVPDVHRTRPIKNARQAGLARRAGEGAQWALASSSCALAIALISLAALRQCSA